MKGPKSGLVKKNRASHNEEEILRTSSDYDDEDDGFDFGKTDEFKRLMMNPIQNFKAASSVPPQTSRSQRHGSSILGHDQLLFGSGADIA